MKKKYKPIFEGVEKIGVEAIFEGLDGVRQLLLDGFLEQILQMDSSKSQELCERLFGENFESARLREKVEIAVQKMAKGSVLLKEALGISEESMEALYFMGHAMFQQRNYPAARHIFELMVQLDAFAPKYYQALASTQHRQKDFFAATSNYMHAYLLSPINNPELHYHAADCYLRMDDSLSAILSLGHCIEGCNDRQALHRQIKTRAIALREVLVEKRVEQEQRQTQAQKQQNEARSKSRKIEPNA